MAIGTFLVMMTEQMAKKQKVEKMLIHRLAYDEKGYFVETCVGNEIRLKRCHCECEENNG